MPDPGFTLPDLCPVRAAAGQAEPAGAVRGGLSADGHPPAGDDPPAPLARGIDRAIRLSTAAAVLAVAGIAAYVSYWHAYAVVRAHGETGIGARLEPATIDGLVWASSMVVLYAARHRVPVPSLARWLLALGIAATLTANMAQGWSRGPVGAVVAAWRRSVSWARTNFWSGSSAPPGRQHAGRWQGTSIPMRPAVLRRVLSRPSPLTASTPEQASAARQTRHGTPRVRPPGSRPSPPALSMTRRWPRTGSACRPATRSQNAGSPRCSDAHPAAGREPGSPMPGKHRRSQTRRAPWSRLTSKQGSSVSPECDLTASGRSGIRARQSAAITTARAGRVLKALRPEGAVETARCELAADLLDDLRRIDARIRETRKTLTAAVAAAGTSLTGLFGVGPVIAAAVIGDVRDVSRFPGRDHFAAYNGTAPIEVSSGQRKVYRLSRRGNRRLNHAIHMAAITQIRNKHSQGRAYYDKKLAEGKTGKEALRSLKRQVSNAIFACLQADARRAAARSGSPGGQQGNDSVASAAGSHPRHRLFGQATPGPGHHPTTAASNPASGPAIARGRAGHSPVAATMPARLRKGRRSTP